MKPEPEILEGIVADIIFHNDDNGYTVCVFETEDEQFTAVGNIPMCRKGQTLQIIGFFKVHPTYGEQFAIQEFEEKMPEGASGIKEFLSSGALKGIGPKTAAAIVAKFGEHTLEVIEDEPGRLTAIPGIGPKKAESIAESFREHKNFAEILMYFRQFGISTEYALKLHKTYGDNTIEAVKENPYRLVDDIFGIGFKKADSIALKMNISKEDPFRIKSGIIYLLSYFAREGNTYCVHRELLEAAGNMLDVPMALIDEIMVDMAFDGQIYIENLGGSTGSINSAGSSGSAGNSGYTNSTSSISNTSTGAVAGQTHMQSAQSAAAGQKVVYLKSYYIAEQTVARCIRTLTESPVKPIDADIASLIAMSENERGIKLSERQKEAVTECLRTGVSIITGGPGTGKTTIINSVIEVLRQSGLSTSIAAPTGRAAKRITETSGEDASTIHKLLEYSYSDDEDMMFFGKNQDDPLDADAIIIDEASMIDIKLMEALVLAIKPGSRLIMVGDGDQLPPVGAGNVLVDMIRSEYVCAFELTEIFRQAAESLIVVNAHRINHGDYPEYNEKNGDFFLVRQNSDENIREMIKVLCSKRLPAYYTNADPVRDIQVVSPVKKGTVGIYELNRELQAILNPPDDYKAEKKFGDKTFREGDKVMQIRNDYGVAWKRFAEERAPGAAGGTTTSSALGGARRAASAGAYGAAHNGASGLGSGGRAYQSRSGSDFIEEGMGIFNGDCGYVEEIDNENGQMTVVFDEDRYVTYDYSNLDELELAYAITVHKSQGSEFPIVVMPITRFPPMLATRNLLYTAVTRGKSAVVLVGSENMLRGIVDNNRTAHRNSGLEARLRRFLNDAPF